MRHANCNFSLLSRTAITGAMMATVLASCASPSLSPSSSLVGTCLTSKAAPLALVLGERSNVPTIRLPAQVNPLLEAAANDKQQISLVRIDGEPKVFTLPAFSPTAQNAAARTQEVVNYLNASVGPVLRGEIHSQAPQADVLTALDLAASAAGPDGNIILVDSGLQTVTPLEYQRPDLLVAPPSDVVAYLRQRHLLPDLSGRHVLLSGFGYTASPQPALNEAQRDSVINQWVAIVNAGGGCVTVDTTPNTASAIAGLPPVSIVTPPTTPPFNTCGTFTLADAGAVGFAADTATFRDPSAAEAALSRLADTIKQGTEHVTLIGSTSSEGSDALNDLLSLHRAKAVEEVLVSLGISADRITVEGDGSHWPGRVNDIAPGGTLLPAQAEQNREVIVQLPHCK